MAPARAKKKASSRPAPGKKQLTSKKAPAPKKAAPKKAAPKKAAPKKAAPKKVAPKKAAPKKAAAKELPPVVSAALDLASAEGLIDRLPPPVQPVVKLLRQVVLEVAPEAKEQIENGHASYFANGVFARIEPSEQAVLVRFLKGGALPSAHELPGEGESRALSFTSVAEFRENVLRKVVREAVMLNLSNPAEA